MWGFELTLSDDRKVPGVIFPDGTVYAHKPIADSYASMRDLLTNYPLAQDFRVIGPVIPTEEALQRIEKDFRTSMKEIESLIQHYVDTKAWLLTRRDGKPEVEAVQ